MAGSGIARSRFGGSPGSSEDVLATPLQRNGARAMAVVLALAATLAATLGRGAGPVIVPLIPIAATVWSLADVLTALILLTQFYTTGRFVFGILSIAYGFSGLITWAYVACFPGVFSSRDVSIASEQISNVLWIGWHCTFPALLTFAVVADARFERFSCRPTALRTIAIAAVPVIGAGAVAFLVILFRNALPQLVVHGIFEPAYRFELLPILIALNACATIVLASRQQTPLRLWLAIALFSSSIDVLLVDLSGMRYSYIWDAGKLVTVLTGSVVLIMMLWDVIGMYGRLARVARIDVLTSLKTRYAFEERLRSIFADARRRPGSLALLRISVDAFGRYAQEHGTVSSQECLRRIARELLDCADRPGDLAARYGAEDFVVLLAEASLARAWTTAERIRSIVERLEITLGRAAVGRVTVSIGIAHTKDTRIVVAPEFLEAADRALKHAIDDGRNRVMLVAAGAASEGYESPAPQSLAAPSLAL